MRVLFFWIFKLLFYLLFKKYLAFDFNYIENCFFYYNKLVLEEVGCYLKECKDK